MHVNLIIKTKHAISVWTERYVSWLHCTHSLINKILFNLTYIWNKCWNIFLTLFISLQGILFHSA